MQNYSYFSQYTTEILEEQKPEVIAGLAPLLYFCRMINTIILDLGVVIIDVDYQRTATAFKNLGITGFDELYSKKKQERFFDGFEKGDLSVKDFRSEVRKHLAKNVSDQQIDDAWNAMIGHVPQQRFNFLQKLSASYRLFLLSNTNEIHIKKFSAVIEKDYGLKHFYSLFENVYLSSELGMRKPDREIFDLLIQENKLDKSHCLFVDDTLHHVEGARNARIMSLHLGEGEELSEILPKFFHSQSAST